MVDGHIAMRSGPPSACRTTVARVAPTACAAASARAGSRVVGSGLSPIRRLSSASASYGAARRPYAARSATLTAHSRNGWNAMATTAVTSNEARNDSLTRSPSSPPIVTTATT